MPPILPDKLDPLPDASPAYPDIELFLLRAEPGSLVEFVLGMPGLPSILLFTPESPAAPEIELVFLCLANVDLPEAGTLRPLLLKEAPPLASSSLPWIPGCRFMFFISADYLVGGRVSLSLLF